MHEYSCHNTLSHAFFPAVLAGRSRVAQFLQSSGGTGTDIRLRMLVAVLMPGPTLIGLVVMHNMDTQKVKSMVCLRYIFESRI